MKHRDLFLPLLAKVDDALEKGPVILAIDGGSASGKTTLSQILQERCDCSIFHMDDFFLRPEQRTARRYAEAGGNVDRERFEAEVLIPLRRKEPFSYRRFDCSTMALCDPTPVTPRRLTVIEGAYSMHPALAPYYDLSVFLDITPELQKQRILKRNSPQSAARFFETWIPLEQTYFREMQVRQRCDLVISISE